MAEEKPFICYQTGKSAWAIKIVPRNKAGWVYFALWMLGFFAMSLALIPFGDSTWAVGGFVVATLIWATAMTLWMKARSEIVNTDELLALQKEMEKRKGRGR